MEGLFRNLWALVDFILLQRANDKKQPIRPSMTPDQLDMLLFEKLFSFSKLDLAMGHLKPQYHNYSLDGAALLTAGANSWWMVNVWDLGVIV
ncbi:hypothetical protein QQP08_002075 [Theobroma cacao]|nr:hypothetical protein QQP08_002075 [Theobroma cacao]